VLPINTNTGEGAWLQVSVSNEIVRKCQLEITCLYAKGSAVQGAIPVLSPRPVRHGPR
jgi:hypothetical protein